MRALAKGSVETVVKQHGFVHRTYFQNPIPGAQGSGINEHTCPFCYRRTKIHFLTWSNNYVKNCVHCGAKMKQNGARITYAAYSELSFRLTEEAKNKNPLPKK